MAVSWFGVSFSKEFTESGWYAVGILLPQSETLLSSLSSASQVAIPWSLSLRDEAADRRP